ncbi:MAG: hypothetical protein KF712_05505 [Akkermansiaceae bacterium]|nr:hypothetical protein [Akkermansiaceae bacterium]
MRLHEVGRDDIASDIERSVERLRKAAAQKQVNSTGGTNASSKEAPGTNDDGKGDSDHSPLWPWLAAGGALIAALVAYFRMKGGVV